MGNELGRFLQDGELLLREFDNPEDLLQENPLFGRIFYSLCQGMSPYKAIEELVNITTRYQEQLKEIVEKGVPTITVELNEGNLDLLFQEAFFSDDSFPDW